MHAAISHLARRGVEHYATFKEEYEYQMPAWGIVMLASTVFFYFITSSAIEYTFGRVIPTLVMIESPQDLLFEPLDAIDADAPITKNPTEPQLLLVKQKPITSSFRAIIRHLQSKAGFRARFRGLSLFIVYSMTLSFVSNLLGAIPFVPRGLAGAFATILLANLSLAWTHIVISDPSPKPWYRRLPGRKAWKKVAGPTAVFAIAEQLTILLPLGLAQIYGFDPNMDPRSAGQLSRHATQAAFWKGMSVLILCVSLGIFTCIPAMVALVRVQASMLADSEESIVPFDRSFGGKVIPEIVGGSGVIGLKDAWTTFDWNARVRLIKTYVKVFAMQMSIAILFIAVTVAQLFIIIGKSDLKKIIKDPKDGSETTVSF